MTVDSGLDIGCLRIFIETAKDCNMSRAAQALGVSQPAVSASIKKIETVLGTNVFDRNTRPIQLTTAGRMLWNRCSFLLEQFDSLTPSIKSCLLCHKVDLRIGCSDCMSNSLSPSLMNAALEFTENLSVKTGSTPAVSQMLSHNQIDIGLSSDPMVDVENVQALPLLTEEFLFVVPKSLIPSPNPCFKEVYDKLSQLPYLRFGKETFDFVQSERIYRGLHFKDTRRIEVDTNKAMMSLIAYGRGWCILPPLSIWMGKEFAGNVNFFKFRAEATRCYFVLYQSQGFANIAEKIRTVSAELFVNEILPQINKELPDLLKFIHLNEKTERCQHSLASFGN